MGLSFKSKVPQSMNYRDHDTVGQSQNFLSSTPDGTTFGSPLRLSVEPDFVLDIVTGDLEWVEVLQPGIGCLELTPVGGD